MPNINIRLATTEDQTLVMGIYAACTKADPLAGWSEYYPNEEVFTEDVKEGSLFVCEAENEPVGAFSLHLQNEFEEKDFAFSYTEKPGMISRLCILPTMQGRGLGRGILAAAQSTAKQRGYGCIHLLCDVLNGKANQLYLSEGYLQVAQVDLYGNRYNVLEIKL